MSSSTPIADLYEVHFRELVEIATNEFSIPVEDAEQLAHDVFLSAICPLLKPADPHMWLVGAMTCAARHYNDKKITRVAQQGETSVDDGTGWVH